MFLEEEEKIFVIKKGDVIVFFFGVVIWWYNKVDIELVIFFLGDISKVYKVGRFIDFFLIGSNGIFIGFIIEFVSRVWDLDEKIVNTFVGK